MTQRCGQVFKAILALFLFPITYCSGAIRYVNINNPAPGAGTSWATAFNNLQSALAVSNFFDQIWVAQGTYKPSTPAGRSATFLLPGGTFIYGGFNGTETAVTQRNPTLNPTILSGDIGVAGDPTDNCYHVVTIENSISNPTLDGFTIRDGRADAGYPASSVAQADNTGGGVLVLAYAGETSAFTMNNCILTGNFAVYGGALGGFGDGGNQTNQGGSSCMFNGNQAVYGGAIANIADNGNWAALNYSSCIFINNTASTGNASVVYQSLNNAANNAQTNLQNCLFYNEAIPMFTSLTGDANSYWFDIMNCIIWTSGSAYTGGYNTGNSTIRFDYCDIDGTLPSNAGFDADPLFVNAAGGDFHVSPCSPVVDAGFPYVNPGQAVDFAGNDRVQGAAVDIGPYEQSRGTTAALPTATPPTYTYCRNTTASQLTASGANLLWYTTATGGTGSPTAPTPSTASTGTTAYYVTQTPATSCESNRLEIDVTVSLPPAAPTSNPIPPYCQNTTAAQLTAGGANLLWYTTATGGTGDPTAPTPSTASPVPTTWYVSQTASGCESLRTPITVTIISQPAAPTSNPIPPYCQNTTAAQLTAGGANLLWYTTATGGTGDPTAPTPSTASPVPTTWYVSQTASGCESLRTPITVTIISQPAAPTSNPIPPYCQNTTAAQLTAGGANLLWYTTATGGTGNPTAPTPNTANPGSTTWYVSQTTSGSCESPRIAVTVAVNANPRISIDPVNGSVCAGGTVKLQANGADSYQWSPATGLSDPSASDPVAQLQANMLYTVTGTTAGCSATAELTLTVGTDCMGYYVPNAFSPNGDGANDLFRVKTGDVPRSFDMIVFNRYGGKIFESTDILTGWNGAIGGNLAPAGTYVYTVVLTTSAGNIIRRQGTVILVR